MKLPVKVDPVKNWSPSALRSYEECARKFMLERLAHLCTKCFEGAVEKKNGALKCRKCGQAPPPQSQHLTRGNEIHEAAEKYIRGLRKDLADELKEPKVRKRLMDLRKGYAERRVRTELQLAFTRDWKLTDYYGSDVYCRFKVDVLEFVSEVKTVVTDWKTGRPKPDEYDDQLESYAVCALSAGFGDETSAELVFTDHNLLVSRPAGNLLRSGLQKIQQVIDKRVRKLFIDKEFPPRPQNNCRWCPYSANVGGPCEY